MANFVHVIPAFVLTALLLAIVPGQTVAMILRQAIIGGTKTAYTTLLGTSTALIFWGAASAIGLSQIFARSQTAYTALKYAGVAFLTFLALQTLWSLRNEFGKFDYEGSAKTGLGPAFRLGLLTNLICASRLQSRLGNFFTLIGTGPYFCIMVFISNFNNWEGYHYFG